MTADGMDEQLARARAIEIVGPPGAGKSTLLDALTAAAPGSVARPVLRDVAGRPAIALAVVGGLATLAGRVAFARGGVEEQVRMIAHLRVLARAIARDRSGRLYFFDQGPIFYLTRSALGSSRLDDWRRNTLEVWARTLDLVVWLDAPDEVLARRVDARDKVHQLQGATLAAAGARLAEVRATYEAALTAVSDLPDGPVIARFDTATLGTEAIARAVGAGLRRERANRPSG